MNFGLAREIYGITPWCVDAHSLPGLLGILNSEKALELPETKYNSCFAYNPEARTQVAYDQWDLRNAEQDADIVGVVLINGPITLNGGASSYGMKQVSENMLKMHKDDRVKSFVLRANSGGGASAAVEVMSDTINFIKQTKPVYGSIEKGGMAASACFGILSACTKIYSESKMNIVGSAGTMIEFVGRKANTVDPEGRKHIRLYAPKSKRKNEAFEEALNNDNYDILVDDLLKPVNENFINLIESNRPILKGTDFDDGHTMFSKDAVGTFIDGIKSFEEVVSEAMFSLPISNNQNNQNNQTNNINNSKMTKAELQSKHPELVSEIFNEGVSSEADRTGAWMAHLSTDSKAVVDGIQSGKNITQTQTQQFIVKQAANSQKAALKSDSPEDVITAEGSKGAEEGKQSDEVANFYKNIDSNLNGKK
ncbi:ATP-dependent Clp protease proteolytic subunit [Tenacibaculum finnmarkense]|uniref:ATP-dependent Clp protease proteolytic subunit n=1 Tax=Tenacibaculum finnmarkense TaxID=2781243 RepID=UPI0020797520|nr:ATP-dependent Clp protease proteolytic subunit [Tenacibaculum finnmarkense]MCM8906827.1 ATP-dependent Clp protease proteolytic subunit [Tenacibaculum finnmarkense genomovar finnmarkense]